MITFDLQCRNGHHFEGWFEGRDSFDSQISKGMVLCPHCSSNDVSRVISTFATRRVSSSKINPDAVLAKLRGYINKHFDDVGTNFTSEALKMHYGVAKQRNIRGVSSPEEEKVMSDDGVQFFKIPLHSGTRDRD